MNKILRQTATVVFALTVLMWVFTPTLTYARTVNIKGLDTYIKKTMTDWQVPGLAIALVKNDKVVFMKGYGIRKLGETGRVDKNTIFPIGSASKLLPRLPSAFWYKIRKFHGMTGSSTIYRAFECTIHG